MSDYYDRKGRPINSGRWAELWGDLSDPPYKRIAETRVEPYRISTVWLGMNHNWNPNGTLHIFETMVFGGTEFDALDEYTQRYATEEQALQGHQETVDLVREDLVMKRAHVMRQLIACAFAIAAVFLVMAGIVALIETAGR